MKTIIVASKNSHKIREIKDILADTGFKIIGLDDFKNYVVPKETGETFMENARLKALALRDFIRDQGLGGAGEEIYVLADDSGLECEDLHGAPGVNSARFAGENATADENNQKLISMYQDVTHWSRAAQYNCAIVLILPDGTEKEIEETCQGHIVLVPKGQNGFGYDPYFYLESDSKTMAELTPEEKNQISHRGKALRKLLEELNL